MKLFTTLLTLIVSINTEQYTTNELWKMNGNVRGTPYYRPGWAKNVTIEYEDTKILSIEGIIIPIKTTVDNISWRPNDNCDPYNSCFINGTTSTCKGKTTIEDGYDRGHIMALSNGGPNIRLNVISQPHDWQAIEKTNVKNWRALEIKIQEVALDYYGRDNYPIHLNDVLNSTKPNNIVSWKINLNYKEICENEDMCSCSGEPESYDGFVYINDSKQYEFSIINNETYNWELYTPEPHYPDPYKINLIPIIILCIIILIILSIVLVHSYKKHKHRIMIREIENHIDLELGEQ